MNKFMAQILKVAANGLASKKAEKNSDAIAPTLEPKHLLSKQALSTDRELQLAQKKEISQSSKLGLFDWQSIAAICILWVSTLFCITAMQMTSGRLMINLEVEKSKIKLITDIDKRERHLPEKDMTQNIPSSY
ncbi:hypothetical protein NDA01_07845 [Trichocoleus desertorum AS-A10]|uniref:hypothetical protein n=1 Tax=Trichocoleus desertorum TaxID=1481672 RepID=UPI00329779C0